MADNSPNHFGGTISLEIDGVLMSPTEADIKVEPTNFSVSAKANQDGSPCYQGKPELVKLSFNLRKPSGIKWNDVMRKKTINVTAYEVDNNRTHMLTGTRITGKPSLNITSGEIDGLTCEGGVYTES
jgi:hypothetical protein